MAVTQNLTCDQGGDLVFGITFVDNAPVLDWTADTDYVTGQYVQPTDSTGFFYTPQADGLSGSTEPTWPTTVSDTVEDGSITWICSAAAVTPVDLTDYNAYMSVAASQSQITTANPALAAITDTASSEGVIVLGGTAGTIAVTVFGATTLNFTTSPLYYDLFVVNPAGPVSKMVCRGKITVNANVTVPTY